MRHFAFLSVDLVPHRQGLPGHLSSKAVGIWHTKDAWRMNMGCHYHRTSVIISGTLTVWIGVVLSTLPHLMSVNSFNLPCGPVRWALLESMYLRGRNGGTIICLRLHLLPPFTIPREPGLACHSAARYAMVLSLASADIALEQRQMPC